MTPYERFSVLLEESFPSLVASLQKLVRIKSVNAAPEDGCPFGRGIHDCLTECLSLGAAFGFRTRDIDGMCGYAEYGAGEEMIAVLTHLDIVPEGDGWQYPPYGAEIIDGKLYGRGSVDDKGPAVAALYALKTVKDSGVPLRRRIRVIFGCDEELGSRCMAYYAACGEEMPVLGFTPDAGYPIINGEKGSLTLLFKKSFEAAGECRILSLTGGKGANVVPDTADAAVALSRGAAAVPENVGDKIAFFSDGGSLHIHADGVSAHAARPQGGENAIGRLLLWLNTLPLAGEQKKTVAFLAERFGMEVYGESLGLCQHDDISGELTVNLGMISLNDGELGVHLNIRTPVTANVETIHARLCSIMTEHGFEEAEAKVKAPLYVPPDSELVQKLSAAFEGMTGEKAYTRTIGGGTYAKAMLNVVAFGPNWPGEPPLIHRANEHMELEKLKKHARITAAAMYELAR